MSAYKQGYKKLQRKVTDEGRYNVVSRKVVILTLAISKEAATSRCWLLLLTATHLSQSCIKCICALYVHTHKFNCMHCIRVCKYATLEHAIVVIWKHIMHRGLPDRLFLSSARRGHFFLAEK